MDTFDKIYNGRYSHVIAHGQTMYIPLDLFWPKQTRISSSQPFTLVINDDEDMTVQSIPSKAETDPAEHVYDGPFLENVRSITYHGPAIAYVRLYPGVEPAICSPHLAKRVNEYQFYTWFAAFWGVVLTAFAAAGLYVSLLAPLQP